MYLFEICANSVESCLAAQEGGANRVELCAGIPEGGTTPSYGEILLARELLQIKLHVIIRPRGGDFLYTDTEIKIMEKDIGMAKEIGVDGVVFGCLTSEGEIDCINMKKLMQASGGLPVTFHRAFDMCCDPFKAVEQLTELGCTRILTSGQMSDAETGIPLLKKIVDYAGNDIIIMPGCGITKYNILKIAKETGAKEFHFSARVECQSNMNYKNSNVSMGGVFVLDEYIQKITTKKKVEEIIHRLNQ